MIEKANDVSSEASQLSSNHDIDSNKITTAKGLLALSPIVVFILLYLGVSVALDDFYKMPLSVAFIAASAWAFVINRKISFKERIETFSRSAAQSNIVYMLWIFILAGAFAELAKSIGSIDATVSLTLSILPSSMLLPGLFFAACFISMSIGTSVGTVIALVPLAVDIAATAGENVPLFVATVLGGAFFGDNLSFISDTTIAATRTQFVAMNVKFKANLRIVLPAAIICLIIYVVIGHGIAEVAAPAGASPWLVLPYISIIALAAAGVNVILVLISGIIIAVATGLFYGFSLTDMAGSMGEGIDSMGSLIIITLLSTGMLGLIKEAGGINYLLAIMTSRVNSPRGAKAVIAALVSVVNICTANNTVAIITVGSLSHKIAMKYGVSGARTASLLDTCSCTIQCLIPYGAQTLLATGLASISPAAPWPYLFYPWTLAVMVLVAILYKSKKSN